MPWSPGKRTASKYRSTEHKAERAHRLREMKRHGSVDCAQPECVMSTRTILWDQHEDKPAEPVALGHDDTGEYYIGLVHKRCNDRDGAKRGNARARGVAEEQLTRERIRSRDW